MAQFRAFRLADKVAESDIITSFYLEPCDGQALWEVKPGQYLTLRVPGPDGPVCGKLVPWHLSRVMPPCPGRNFHTAQCLII